MGFYGNITNQSKTQFQFDRTYPSRYEMDRGTITDGVYAGRYILVEYDTPPRNTSPGSGIGYDQYPTIYRKWYEGTGWDGTTPVSEWRYYNSQDGQKVITESDLLEGQCVNCRTILNTGAIGTSTILLICEGFGAYDKVSGEYVAEFRLITDKEDNYTKNYQLDVQQYGPGRGWDSTVWQKVYTNGVEKYVMIAELNSVVPTFTLTSDAPTITPIMPHFDKDSTNVYYRMHYQPQWGFRVKSAKNYIGNLSLDENGKPNIEGHPYDFSMDNVLYPSDGETAWLRYEYDKAENKQTPLYFSGETETWLKGVPNAKLDAAIYFNKAGFNKEKITYSSDNAIELASGWKNKDEIKIETTGQSGHEYNRHDGTPGTDVQVDTQEISVMLPSIGNAIAEVWNIVYGDEELNKGRDRNLDIEWGSTEGLRAVTPLPDGYKFDPHKTHTIAGVINSVHDLMGMIIQSEEKYFTQAEIDDLSLGSIYYFENDGTFRRKHETYEYTEVEYIYRPISSQEVEPIYRPELFYEKVQSVYVKDVGPFDPKKQYYEKLIPDIKYDEASIKPYEKGKYYYKDVDGNYFFEDFDQYQIGRNYYEAKWSEEPVQLHEAYKPNTYYYKANEKGDYYVEKTQTFDDEKDYFSIDKGVEHYMYAPNTFYTFDENGNNPRTDRDKGIFDENQRYYIFVNESPVRVYIEKYEPNKYWKLNEEGHFIKQTAPTLSAVDVINNQELIPFYEIRGHNGDPLLPFYQSGVYYTKQGNNYLLSVESNKILGIDYYKIDKSEKIEFYVLNKYYIFDAPNNRYTKSDKEYDENQTYYIKNEYYLMEDEKEIFTPGAVWNSNVLRVPATIKVGTRKAVYEMQVLEGFARQLNTIHGLILKLNYMLEAGDTNTRDVATAQGAINSIKDLIEKIEELTPGQLVIINDMGQVAGANYTTAQELNYKNYGNNETGRIDIDENRWIKVDVNEENKVVTFNHMFNKISDTTTSSDNNTKSGVEKDRVKLYAPIVDNMGHVVGNNIETVTLPYGFKSLATNGANAATTNLTANNNTLIANNTQDLLTINPQNKWIRMANNAGTNTLEIGHEVNAINTTAKATTDLNNPATDTITLQDIVLDAAGHVTENRNHTYTLPYGYKHISVIPNGESAITVSANNTQDTFSLESLNKWIVLSGDDASNKIQISHLNGNIVQETATGIDLDNQDNFNIQSYELDSAGHFTKSVITNYKLPDAIKSLKATNLGTNAGSIKADLYNDEMTFDAANKWLTLETNGKTLSLKHKLSLNQEVSQGEAVSNNDTNYTFKVPTLTSDEAGHITSLSSYDVSLPKVKLINPTETNVLTGLTITADNEITVSGAYVGNLALTGYNELAENPLVLATDTVNQAIEKVENKIKNVEDKIIVLEDIIDFTANETSIQVDIPYPEGLDMSNSMVLNQMFLKGDSWLIINQGGFQYNIELMQDNIKISLLREDASVLEQISYRIALMKI